MPAESIRKLLGALKQVRLPAFILELALELWCPWPLPSFILLNTQRRGTTGLSTGSEYHSACMSSMKGRFQLEFPDT